MLLVSQMAQLSKEKHFLNSEFIRSFLMKTSLRSMNNVVRFAQVVEYIVRRNKKEHLVNPCSMLMTNQILLKEDWLNSVTNCVQTNPKTY